MAALPQRHAYFTINPTLIDDLTPHYAGWYAGDDPWSSISRACSRVVAAVEGAGGRPGLVVRL